MKNFKKQAAKVVVAAATILCVGATAVGGTTFGMLPQLGINAEAATGVSYINAAGDAKVCNTYTKIKSSTTSLTGGWYVVSGKVTIDGRLKVTKDSYIILTDGSRLTVKGGINVASGCKFNVYTDTDSSAALYAGTTNGSNTTVDSNQCGIGGSGAKVNIVGGNVYAKGGSNSYGIMGSDIHLYWTNPTDSVYASSYKGTVSVCSPFADKKNGAAYSDSIVTATALKEVTLQAAKAVTRSTTSFDDGVYAVFDKISVADRIDVSGDVELYLAHNSTLTAELGISVNKGNSLNIYGNGGKLYAGTRNGSTSLADDSDAGIGASDGAKAGEIVINNGTVYANGGRNAAGIGGSNANISILGGEVTATGGRYGAGIGSGYNDNGADINILGGEVSATGGTNAAGIGSGYGASRSDITLSYTNNNDSIYASSYSGIVNFKKTMYTSDGQTAKSNNIDGKTLSSKVTGYTVTFESNGGTYCDPVVVKANGYINSLPTPRRNGYTFGGWFTDKNFYYQFDNRYTNITRNITLYAKWNSGTCTVKFESNGAGYVGNKTVNYGDRISIMPYVERDGYVFDGWYTDKNFRYRFNDNSAITSDLTLYAKWTAGTYEVIFDANGGYFPNGDRVDYRYVAPGKSASSVYPSDPYFTNNGIDFVFDGWFYDSLGNRRYNGEAIYASTTLYASYYCTDHTVTFVTNGGSYMAPMTVSDGGTLNKRGMDVPDRNGFTFDGWYTDSSLLYEYDFSMPIYSDLTLYAGWIQDVEQHTVTFYIDGSRYDTQTVNHGEYAENIYGNYSWMTGSNRQFSFGEQITEDLDLYTYTMHSVTVYVDDEYAGSMQVRHGDYADLSGYSYVSTWQVGDYGAPFNPGTMTVTSDLVLKGYSSNYAGSTFGGAGLIAAIAGGAVLVGGGTAAAVVINKKKKNK